MNKRISSLIILLLFFNMVTGMGIPRAGAAASSSLQSLALSTGSLNETFDPNTKAYTATVPNNVSNITVTPTVSKRSSVFGYALFAGGSSPSGLTISGDSNTIVGSVHVNGDLSLKGNGNGITQTAEVVGSVNNHDGVIGLVQPSASIPLPQINLTEFKKNVSKTYTTSLNLSDVNLDGNIFVDGDVNISGSKIQGKGTVLATGSIHIAGSNLKYSSVNDSVVFYSMNGDIDIDGSGGEIDGGLFAPTGEVKLTGHDNKIYGSVIVNDIDIAGSTNQIINDSQLGSAVVRINDKVVPSGMASQSIPLNVGPNTIKVDVTEFDGTLNSYTITVTRTSNNADLFNLTVSTAGNMDVPLSPPFQKSTINYSANVDYMVPTVAVLATLDDPTATVVYKMGDQVVNPAQVPLTVGSNLISVVVTAQDGTQKTYTITITREGNTHANLLNLTINPGTLSPDFAPDTLGYTGNVPAGTQSVRVTATAAEEGSAITVNGVSTPSGQPSEPLNLVAGTNTIKVTVTAPNGTTKTYTITITKSEVPPMFSLSQQMIIGDYVMVKITPDQSTIMDNTEWYKYDLKDGQRQWIKFATGHFPTSDGAAVSGITLASTVDDNGAAHFVYPQTVLIKAVTNGLSAEKPLAVDFSSTNGQIDGSGYKFKILASSNGGTQNMATSGNRAAKVSIVYNIKVSDGLTVNFVNGTPNYVMKDQAGNKVLEGELYKDGVNQDSTPTVKFIKSTNGYTEQYRIQATIDMILATSSGEKLPLTLYSDPLSVTVESRERLQ